MTVYAPYRIPRVRVGDQVGTETPLRCCGRTMSTRQSRPHAAATHACISCDTRVIVGDDGRISAINAEPETERTDG